MISGKLPSKSGWIERADVRTFNTYHPSAPWRGGRASGAKRWQELLEKLYPDEPDILPRAVRIACNGQG